MSHLNRLNQETLVLRPLSNEPLARVGRRLGLADGAAQKRVSRAPEKLRIFSARRGLRVAASVIGLLDHSQPTESWILSGHELLQNFQ
ncbi:MAG: hypothetical protein WCL11_08380 [Verrucomicrobiota bacterium]